MEPIGILKKYQNHFKELKIEENQIISLQEGNTPLIEAKHLDGVLKDVSVYFKVEGMNPTGSFKDRGMTAAVTMAVKEGSKAIICASTGNTSASAAAYAARAGLKCIVLIPEGKIAMGKLAQAIIYGAKVIQIKGNFDDALNMVRECAEPLKLTIVNSINPYRLQGQKTGAFEIVDVLGKAPDYQFMPVGNAGNISAYYMGYEEYFNEKKIEALPKMMGVQAAGAAPIVENRIIEEPETVATAIRIGNPASWKKAVHAANVTGGSIFKVTDEEILKAQKLLASSEGIFAEPASAASLAGLINYSKEHDLKGKKVVCILTGNGLKDPDIVLNQNLSLQKIPVDIKALEKAIAE